VKDWANYFDEKGILIHIPGEEYDGTLTGAGDSINRLGHYWFCYFASLKLEDLDHVRTFPRGNMPGLNQAILISWDHKENCVARHWKGYPNATDEQYGTSRDQFMPITMAALYCFVPRGIHLLNYAFRHFGCMPNFKPWRGDFNGDFLFPDHWSSLVRACQYSKWYVYPLMWLGDVWRIGSVLVRLSVLKRDKTNVGDSLNLTMELILGQIEKPNFLTRFAARLFAKHSPITPQEQMDYYFHQEHAPPINELYRPLIKKFLS